MDRPCRHRPCRHRTDFLDHRDLQPVRQFEELLGKRQIPIHYSEEDLDQDIRYATGNL